MWVGRVPQGPTMKFQVLVTRIIVEFFFPNPKDWITQQGAQCAHNPRGQTSGNLRILESFNFLQIFDMNNCSFPTLSARRGIVCSAHGLSCAPKFHWTT